MKKMKFVPLVLALFACCMALSGCLSHWFVDSTSRLQVLNDTDDCTLLGIDVVGSDSTYKKWIDETVLPGERSRVVEEDLVGDFTLRLRYTKSPDGSGKEQVATESFSLDGGSFFLVIKSEGDSLLWKFK